MNGVIVPIFGMLIPLVLVPVILGLKHSRTLREIEHAERMRALELGRTLPQDESWWTPPRICVAIGAGVPIGVFLCAWQAHLTGHAPAEIVFPVASAVGIVAVICGSLLAARHFSLRNQADTGGRLDAKYPVDADAYDVVSSRG